MRNKFMALILVIILLFTFGLSGCFRGNKGGDSDILDTPPDKTTLDLEGELTIKTMNKGYGTKYLDDIVAEYKKLNPKAKIEVKIEGDMPSIMATELPAGVAVNKTDIYFGAAVNYAAMYEDKFANNFGASSLLLDLSSFVNAWLTYDEQYKIKDIIDPALVEMLSIKDNKGKNRTFALPWAAGACGLVYNESIFNEVGVKVPTTTDELLATFPKFKKYNEDNPTKTKIYPIIYGGGNAMAYWEYLTYVWWQQYEGADRFNKYWTLTDGDPYVPNKDYIEQEGQLKALEVTEKLVKGDYVYSGSNGMDAKVAQKYFALGLEDARFAMLPCGDWFENETTGDAGEFDDNFKMMKTPKLSAAITKHGAENVKDGAFTLASTHNVCIPSYTEEKDLALDFLSFYFSEKGAELFTKATGSFLPLTNYDYLTTADKNKMSKYERSQLEIVEKVDYVFKSEYKSPVRYFGGMMATPNGKEPAEKLMVGGKTAKEVFDDFNNEFKKNWNQYLMDAGIE